MIQQVVHEKCETVDATAPAGTALALSVAKELHSPKGLHGPAALPTPVERAQHRAPLSVCAPELMGLRTSAARTHRHKVPLKRLTAMAA
ncbi:hypothetical protein [Streptomyces sp. NPDC004065]|uniref:hypothetical protein n=1 Tax=Streptomyces sp. NPDC004065 TaxID=3364689 RepID=UPI00384F964D